MFESRKTFFTLFLVTSLSFSLSSQDFSEEFLNSLPDDVQQQLLDDKSADEAELDRLFRIDSSIDNNQEILRLIKDKLDRLEKDMSDKTMIKEGDLKIFGKDFFSSIQASFMPVNLPNFKDDYVLNIGDSLNIMLTGSKGNSGEEIIQRDGSIMINGFGKVNVAGLSLGDATRLIQNFISTKEIGIDVYVSLSKLRDIQVVLLGAVEGPGVYTFSPGSNLLFAINAAGGINDNGSYRSIELRRDGFVKKFDLYDIFVFGNFDPTYQLQSGDIIFVNPKSFRVSVTGGVSYPALYEILPGETLHDVIQFSGGFDESFTGYDFINIKRSDTSGHANLKINIQDINSFPLAQRDSILVPFFTYQPIELRKVSIEGMVNRPGDYFIEESETLSSLIERAGGYKNNAYPFGGMLLREGVKSLQTDFSQKIYSDTLNYLSSSITRAGTSFDSSVLEYIFAELKQQNFNGRIITEFDTSAINLNNELDTVLLDQDKIIIPELQKVVYLFGDFNSSSILPYNPEYTLRDYIRLAGGIRESASNDLLLINPDGRTTKYTMGLLFFNEKAQIYPGSIIYSPRDIAQLDLLSYASVISPILSNLAISLASLNSISNN